MREAALSTRSSNTGQIQDSQYDDGSEHFFVPLSGTGFSRVGGLEKKPASIKSKQLFVSEINNSFVDNTRVSDGMMKYNNNESVDTSSNLDTLNEYDGVVNGGYMSAAASIYADSEGRLSFYDVEETHEQIFSPPFLMDASLSADSFEDLLGMFVGKKACVLFLHCNTRCGKMGGLGKRPKWVTLFADRVDHKHFLSKISYKNYIILVIIYVFSNEMVRRFFVLQIKHFVLFDPFYLFPFEPFFNPFDMLEIEDNPNRSIC